MTNTTNTALTRAVRAYLDTSAWARILAGPQLLDTLRYARKQHTVEILIGAMNVEELGVHPNQGEALRSLRVIKEFVAPLGLVKDLPDLMRNAVRNMLFGAPYEPMLSTREAERLFDDAEDLFAKGLPQPLYIESRRQKKDWLANAKQHFRQLPSLQQTATVPSFEEYWSEFFVSRDMDICLSGICEMELHRPLHKHELKCVRQKCLKALPLATSLLWLALSVFNEVIMRVPPRWGDNYDMRHIIAATHVEWFVSADEPLKAFLTPAGAKFKPRVCGIAEFFADLGDVARLS